MTYAEIIEDNCKQHSPVNWWPYFAYHFTDIDNAVSILKEGCLFSRTDASRLGLMQNENASRQVINITNSNITSKVRFYFRPLTPTQYHNEGLKHPLARFDNANVPIPIFFLFDLEKILSKPNISFSETSMAGLGSILCHTLDEFSKFDFYRIYSIGYSDDEDDKKYRQAEILADSPFNIEDSLRYIICRDNVEMETLINLLRDTAPEALEKYRNIFKVWSQDIFYQNGLFVTFCDYNNGRGSIGFSDTRAKERYFHKYYRNIDNVDMTCFPLDTNVDFYWKKSPREILNIQRWNFQLNYLHTPNMVINGLVQPPEAKLLYIKVFIDGHLMCYYGIQLAESAML